MAGDEKNNLHDGALGWVILGGVAFCVFLLFWQYNKNEVKNMYRWIKYGEMWVVAQVVDDDYMVEWDGEEYNFKEMFELVPSIEKEALTGQSISFISTLAMAPYKIILMILIGIMGFKIYLTGPGTQFRRKLGMDGLIKTQSKTFPYIYPFTKFNPSNQPPRPPGSPVPADLPLFAEALGPEEWLAYNQIPDIDGKIDEKATYRAMASQLGPRWQGVKKLKPYKRVLLAAFCLKAARKRVESDSMLGRIAVCWDFENGLNLKKDPALIKDANKVLSNRDLSGSTLAKINQHAFETPALMRALATAREEGGVLAPSQFVWLRAHNRKLWYPMNNLGRQSHHMEAIGAIAHFKAERMTQRPIPKPKVENAVKSISEYMTSGKQRPIPPLDYSYSKKRGVKKPKAGVKKPKKA
jgi:intracellular multiplication protein IcmP